MDCRRGLWLALGLWGAAGCQHAAQGVATNAPAPAAVTAPAETVVSRKFDDGPKKLPKAETCVKYGDFQAGEACTSSYSPSRRDIHRQEARNAYQRALEVDPKCVPAQQGLARLDAAWKDYPRALARYQKALKEAPKNAALWFEMGMCCNRAQQWDEALKAVSRAASLDPENPTYVNSQGVLLARMGHYPESLACFARIAPEAQAHFKLACTLRRLNQPELSKRELAVALSQDPRLDSARALLAEMTPAPAPPAPAAAPPAIRPAAYTQPAVAEPPAPEQPAEEESIAGPPVTDINLEIPRRPPEQPPDQPPPDKE
jgi:Flp pilus assembly protein TadD